MENQIVFKILPIFFVLFGSLFAVASAYFLLRRRAFMKKALATNGVVIHVDVSRTSGSQEMSGRTHHYPTVRFQTGDGRVVDCKVSFSTGQGYSVGQPVIVNYDPRNPCKFIQLGDPKSQPLMPFLFFGCIGTLFAFIGLVMGFFVFF